MYLTGVTFPACTEACGSVVLHIHQQPIFVPCPYIPASSSVLDKPFGPYYLLASFHGCWPLKAMYWTKQNKTTKKKKPPKTKPIQRTREKRSQTAPVSFQALFRPHASYTTLQRYVIIWQSHVLCYPFSVLRESCWAYGFFLKIRVIKKDFKGKDAVPMQSVLVWAVWCPIFIINIIEFPIVTCKQLSFGNKKK